jgi:hypothetical protein
MTLELFLSFRFIQTTVKFLTNQKLLGHFEKNISQTANT